MKWRDIPIWLKALIIVGVVFLFLWLVDQLGSHTYKRREDLKRKLRKTRDELRVLLVEKNRIEGLLTRVEKYVSWTLNAFKVVLFISFLAFTTFLVLYFQMDIFTGVGTAGAFIGTIYLMVSWLLNSKVRQLQELDKMVEQALKKVYMKRYNVVSTDLVMIKKEITLLEQKENKIQLELNSRFRQ